MKSSLHQADTRPFPFSEIQVSQEISVLSTQSKHQQHKRVESAPLSNVKSDSTQFKQHSKRSIRQTLHFPFLQTRSSMDLQTTERRFIQKQASWVSAKLDGDRESVGELAAFLKSRPPPPENFMSIPEEIFEATGLARKLPFKMFHRHNSKKGSPGCRPMRLPDTAVAAKTTSGRWHIAISIPLEHDYMPQPPPRQPESHSAPSVRPGPGPITVVKPFMEDHKLPKLGAGRSPAGPRTSSIQPCGKVVPFSSLIDAEDTRTLQNYYRQQRIQDLASKDETSTPKTLQSLVGQRDSVTAETVDSGEQNRVTDQRHSGGTTCSESTVFNDRRHSREPSSASSTPSTTIPDFISTKGVEPENRLSVVAKKKKETQSAVAKIVLKSPSSTSINCPTVTESIDSNKSLAYLGKTDTTQCYGASDIASAHITPIRKVARMPGPAPTRKLPDLPQASDDGRSKPNRSSYDQKSIAQVNTNSFSPITSATTFNKSPVKTVRQLRQEKVKALRARDMAALKAEANYQQAIVVNMNKGNRTASETPRIVRARRATAPSRYSKRPQTSSSPVGQEWFNQYTVAPIMVVASVEPPFHDFCFPSPPTGSPERRCDPKSQSSDRAITPTRSVTTSLTSSGDDALHLPHRSSTGRSSKVSIHSNIAHPSHDISVDEAEVETRLKNIEKTNAMILEALSTVVHIGIRFSELQPLLPATYREWTSAADGECMGGIGSKVESSWDMTGEHCLEKLAKDMHDLEPVIRELQTASRISQEVEK